MPEGLLQEPMPELPSSEQELACRQVPEQELMIAQAPVPEPVQELPGQLRLETQVQVLQRALPRLSSSPAQEPAMP